MSLVAQGNQKQQMEEKVKTCLLNSRHCFLTNGVKTSIYAFEKKVKTCLLNSCHCVLMEGVNTSYIAF